MAAYNCILFDLDGVIVDSRDAMRLSFDHSIRDTNAPADASFTRFLAHSGTALKEIVRAMGLPERFYERYRHYARLNEHRVQVVPGIQDLLTELRATDTRLGLVTGKEYDRTCGILNRFDLNTTFDCIIGGDQIRRSKPDPEGVEVAMLFLRAARRTTLFVGDTPNDVIAARRARVDTVGVGWGLSRTPSLRNAGATYVVNTVDRLRALIGRLARGESWRGCASDRRDMYRSHSTSTRP